MCGAERLVASQEPQGEAGPRAVQENDSRFAAEIAFWHIPMRHHYRRATFSPTSILPRPFSSQHLGPVSSLVHLVFVAHRILGSSSYVPIPTLTVAAHGLHQQNRFETGTFCCITAEKSCAVLVTALRSLACNRRPNHACARVGFALTPLHWIGIVQQTLPSRSRGRPVPVVGRSRCHRQAWP